MYFDSEFVDTTIEIPRFAFHPRSLQGAMFFIELRHELTILVENPTPEEQDYELRGEMSPVHAIFPSTCSIPSANGYPAEQPGYTSGSLGPGEFDLVILNIDSSDEFASDNTFDASECSKGMSIRVDGFGVFQNETPQVDAWFSRGSSEVHWSWSYIYDPALATPEPSSLAMGGAGLGLLLLLRLLSANNG